MSNLIQLIYASQPFGFDSSTLNGILVDARRCNTRDDITGALVCRRDIYLQLLEGPEPAVDAAFARIKRDDRHVNIKILVSKPVSTRILGAWAMLHDPAHSRIWDEAEIAGGILDRASPEEVTALFEDLAQSAGS